MLHCGNTDKLALSMETISKIQAKNIQQKWYFTGIQCKHGHIDKRYVNTGVCYGCKREMNKEFAKNNPEATKAISKKAYLSVDINKRNEQRRKWCENNRERRRATVRKSDKKCRSKKMMKERIRLKLKRKNDPFWRLSRNMSKAIWECLKNNKNRLSWLTFVDYTLEDLKIHLESKFKPEMSWGNYGPYWHIDHIRPLDWFNLETEFKKAWALKNLQPLEATINYGKCNRYEG